MSLGTVLPRWFSAMVAAFSFRLAATCLAAAATPSNPSAASVEGPRITAPLDTPQFTQQLVDRVSYMVDNNLNGATLQVSPPQLGPIELRVSVDAGHAQVWLSAHTAAAVAALQSSSPQLREMLGSQGFSQVSVDVSQRSFQDRPSTAQTNPWTPATGSSTAAAESLDAPAATRRSASGSLDAYA